MNPRFDYVQEIRVKLDGKFVGKIIRTKSLKYPYKPNGSKATGEEFVTIEEVKRSIEAE